MLNELLTDEKEWLNEIKRRNKRYFIPNFLCSLFPMQDTIILESHPDMSCNVFELYRYMLKKHVNDKFKIIWRSDEPEKLRVSVKEKNVYFMKRISDKKIEKIKNYFICNRAKLVIDCNRHYHNDLTSKKQINIYMVHGSPIKDVRPWKTGILSDYIVSQSDFFKPVLSEQFMISEDRILGLGFPRNDQLFVKHDSLKSIFSDINDYDKVICWVPTFRVKKGKKRIDSDFNFPLGIPIIYSEEELLEFNAFLKKNNVLIIYKPHPAADLDVIKKMALSNFRFVYTDELLKHDIQTNEFLEQTDAMVGDYSGIYFDYLLLDRPIAITLDDYETYERETGLSYENTLEVLKGDYIYDIEDLRKFILSVIEGKNDKREDLREMCELTNANPGKATQAVYEFIDNLFQERFHESLGY